MLSQISTFNQLKRKRSQRLIKTIWTLEDHRNVSTLQENTGHSCTAWLCIVPLPENIREPYRVGAQTPPQVARVSHEFESLLASIFFIRRHCSDGETLVGSEGNHYHCLSVSQRSPYHLGTRLSWCQPSAISLFS